MLRPIAFLMWGSLMAGTCTLLVLAHVSRQQKPGEVNGASNCLLFHRSALAAESDAGRAPRIGEDPGARGITLAKRFEAASVPSRTEVTSPRSFEIELRDAWGGPIVGHGIALFDGYWSSGCYPGVRFWKGATDSRGIATIEDIDRILDNKALGLMPEAEVSFKTGLKTRSAGVFRVPTAVLSGERLLLRAPPTGILEVRVSDPRGAPVARASVNVVAVASGDRGPERIAHASTNSEGIAAIESIESGLRVEVRVSATDRRWVSVKTHSWVMRPSTKRQIVRLTLCQTPPELRGRLVDERGRPIRATHFTVVRQTDGQRSDWGGKMYCTQSGVFPTNNPITDAEGRFELSFSEPIPSGSHRIFVKITGDRAAIGSRPILLSQPAANRVIPVGDVVMGSMPAMASGVILGTRGQPLRAVVTVERESSPAAGLLQVEGPDRAGTFEVYGPASSLPFILSARLAGYAPSKGLVGVAAKRSRIVFRLDPTEGRFLAE